MPVEAVQHLSFMLPLAMGTVRMIGCSLSPKVMPLILIHALMAGEEGFALEPSALGVSRELRGQLRGLEFVFRQSWELGHMTYIDLGLWFLVSEIGT